MNPLVICPSLHPEAPARPSTLKVLRAKECTTIPYPFVVFSFGLTVESIKEFGGVSRIINHFISQNDKVQFDYLVTQDMAKTTCPN
jgi:hypothetical protein